MQKRVSKAPFYMDVTPGKPGVNPRYQPEFKPLKTQEKLLPRPGSEAFKDIPSGN